MNKKKISWYAANVTAPLGLLLLLAATFVPFFMLHMAWAQQYYPYVYAAGALIVLISRFFSPHEKDERLRRLHRLEVWTGIIFCVGAAFLFFRLETMRDWLAFTLAGAALQLYTSIAIPARQSKIAEEK